MTFFLGDLAKWIAHTCYRLVSTYLVSRYVISPILDMSVFEAAIASLTAVGLTIMLIRQGWIGSQSIKMVSHLGWRVIQHWARYDRILGDNRYSHSVDQMTIRLTKQSIRVSGRFLLGKAIGPLAKRFVSSHGTCQIRYKLPETLTFINTFSEQMADLATTTSSDLDSERLDVATVTELPDIINEDEVEDLDDLDDLEDLDDLDDLVDLPDYVKAANAIPEPAIPAAKPSREELRRRLRGKINDSSKSRVRGSQKQAMEEALATGREELSSSDLNLDHLIKQLLPQCGAPSDRRSRRKVKRAIKNSTAAAKAKAGDDQSIVAPADLPEAILGDPEAENEAPELIADDVPVE